MDGSTPNTNPAPPADAGSAPAPASDSPQNLDKTDAMTYPIGSQNTQPGDPAQPEEDHQSILDKIMGIFSKGKKPEQPQASQPSPTDQAPTNTTPPSGQ